VFKLGAPHAVHADVWQPVGAGDHVA